MTHSLSPPLKPMLAKSVGAIPHGEGYLFEPKWDGFRALVFIDGGEVTIQSRDLKPFNRYFPELIAPFASSFSTPVVLDGEIIIAMEGRLEFEALLLRIHPAKSRVAMLAEQLPASFVAWDLLGEGDRSLLDTPFAQRRQRLEALWRDVEPPLYLTPITADRALAEDWFHRFEGAGLDGVIAKPRDGVYAPGKRTMFKIKHQRTADCVVAGFRWHKDGRGTEVGSLLLGLYDAQGELHHVGVASSFSKERRQELLRELEPLRDVRLEEHPWGGWAAAQEEAQAQGQRLPGGTSRWTQGKDTSWEPLSPERVVEVSYDHMQGRRFRHIAHFVRWRFDKSPMECGYEQLERTAPWELAEIFGASERPRT